MTRQEVMHWGNNPVIFTPFYRIFKKKTKKTKSNPILSEMCFSPEWQWETRVLLKHLAWLFVFPGVIRIGFVLLLTQEHEKDKKNPKKTLKPLKCKMTSVFRKVHKQNLVSKDLTVDIYFNPISS